MIDWLAHYGPQIGTLFFFTTFVGIAVWAFWPSNKTVLDECGKIPFKEQDHG